MSRNGVYVRVLLVVMVVAVLVAFEGRSTQRTPRNTWLPSSYNPVGAGSQAFYETLEDLHWPVERWREPLSRLAAQGTGNGLIITRSAVNWRVDFTTQEDGLLDAWVKRGNTLYLFGPMAKWDDTRDLLEELGATVPRDNLVAPRFFESWQLAEDKKVDATPAPGSAGRLVLPEGPALPVKFPAGAQVLWTAEGAPAVASFPRGKGRVVFVASAQVLSNRFLDQADDLAIMLRLLAPDGQAPHHLFFEESHHGYTTTFALARLTGHPGMRLALLLALLGAATYFGSTFVRFGPVLPVDRAPGRSSLEFLDSIAELYHRADLRNEMMRFLFDEARRHAIQRLNLPAGAPNDVIAARLAQAYPQLPGWKKLAHRFESSDYVAGLPPGGWLRVARELIQIKAALA
jgi:hypothetical protein